MCNVLKNSLVVTEEIILGLNASGKKIRFLLSLDVYYSGRVFKKD
ncbi:MAG: hypothetical protein N2Z80_02670 [Hydrogenothermaceae bacterium]|nr:hypothetical protein [Hydrogenothermaceae bacterium]